jgi:hypothetical protein
MKESKCKLCGTNTTLKESHIVPKSIYKWLKDTSGTSFLRRTGNINVRTQDGIKMYLLCGDCEQKFGTYEKHFKEKIFLPVNEVDFPTQSPNGFDYDDKLFYFLISVWWRTIQWSLNDKEVQDSKYWDLILECEKELKEFLLTYKYPVNFDKIYINMFGYVEYAPPQFKKVNHFFMRSVDPFIMFDDTSCFFSFRIPSFWFFGNIIGLDDKKLGVIRLNPSGGHFKVPKVIMNEPHISSFIATRLRVHTEKIEMASDKQKEIIKNDHLKNIDKFKGSKSFVAAHLDSIRD